MIKIEELQKRIEHLETEVELLKELIKLQNKCPERIIPSCPSTPLQPYYSKEPTLEPPYKSTWEGEEYDFGQAVVVKAAKGGEE